METSKIFKAEKELTKVLKRIDSFEQGLDFDIHEIASKDIAKNLQLEAEKVVERTKARSLILAGTLERAMMKMDLDEAKWRLATVDDLVAKYCHAEFLEVIKRYRKIAKANDWARPWDGVDGIDFDIWKNRLGSLDLGIEGLSNDEAFEKLEQEDEDAKYEAEKEAEREVLRKEEAGEDPEEEPEEYNWLGTEDMGVFDNFAYPIFKQKRDGFAGSMPAMFRKAVG